MQPVRPLRRMRAALEAWIEESNDQGRTLEPPEIVRFWEAKMKETYDARIKQREEQEKKQTP